MVPKIVVKIGACMHVIIFVTEVSKVIAWDVMINDIGYR